MQWLMNICPNTLGWEAWLVLCVAVVAFWIVAVAGAIALFGASARQRRAEDAQRREDSAGSRGRAGTRVD